MSHTKCIIDEKLACLHTLEVKAQIKRKFGKESLNDQIIRSLQRAECPEIDLWFYSIETGAHESLTTTYVMGGQRCLLLFC